MKIIQFCFIVIFISGAEAEPKEQLQDVEDQDVS